jgi:hypothetical protein
VRAQLLHEVDTRIPLTVVREAADGTAEAVKEAWPFVRSVAPKNACEQSS